MVFFSLTSHVTDKIVTRPESGQKEPKERMRLQNAAASGSAEILVHSGVGEVALSYFWG